MARPEQTEKATPKRRADARKKGQIARSSDIASAAVFLITLLILHLFVLATVQGAAMMIARGITRGMSRESLTVASASKVIVAALWPVVPGIALLFAAAMIVAAAANLGQVGLVLTFQPLKPTWNRVNPLTGIKRLVSVQIFITLAKQLLKLGAVGLLFYQGVASNAAQLYSLSDESPLDIIRFVDGLLFGIGVRFGIVLLAVGFADFLWERRRLADSLKMTKTEVRDEQRQQEGNAEAKQAFRRRQRELSRKRMMAAVPRATVIITNPTHFAVALRWDEEKMAAPVVVAKGADLMARRIRDLGRRYEVPIVENPPLARTLYKNVPLDTPIPSDLYAAVAKVIAFIYALKSRPTKGVAAKPV